MISLNYTMQIICCIGDMPKPVNITQITKETGITFTYVYKVMKELESVGIIKSKKESRERFIELTELGEKLFVLFSELHKLIKDIKIIH